MTTRGGEAGDYETAESGTIYWTLSLYIEAEKVAGALGLTPGSYLAPDVFRKVQRGHKPSLALANAIDPLMNDIADRETQGEVQEFLLAATPEDFPDMPSARAAVRQHEELVFTVPESISWTTEGVQFQAAPDGLARERTVKLRRFWLSHNNGGLSYHLSFSHYYGGDQEPGRSGYDPSTLYFLSLLQKLAAPKEYTLSEAMFKKANESSPPYVNVFDEPRLGIDPLDNITIEHRLRDGAASTERFWPFVETVFEIDADILFSRLARTCKHRLTLGSGQYRRALLEPAPFIEVPGLSAPKSRFMFMLHDERFFKRLMPLDPATNESLSRKVMVQPACYQPYEARMSEMMRAVEGQDDATVLLDRDYWKWVLERPEYETVLAADGFVRKTPGSDAGEGAEGGPWSPIKIDSDQHLLSERMKDLVDAVRGGDCFQALELDPLDETQKALVPLKPPVKRHIPAFEAGRTDCLEYLFLAGFNQNIIDFMNQDTSEILDSIDPIYPDSEDQSSDRFFVRYANHRAMITYVPKSRSLETGNDYIGACPYAFLIHVLALHNEFLGRGHEQKTMTRIERIQAMAANAPLPRTDLMDALQDREPLWGTRFDKSETAINQARLATFDQYERFRHDNPFRYETERTVFETLEALRGISRKQTSLALAIDSLEDHAADLQRMNQQKIDGRAGQRAALLNILLGGTGLFGAGQMFYWIGEKAFGEVDENGVLTIRQVEIPFWNPPMASQTGAFILSWTERLMTWVLGFFIALLLIYMLVAVFQAVPAIWSAWRGLRYNSPNHVWWRRLGRWWRGLWRRDQTN
jgi:hypothetical protein